LIHTLKPTLFLRTRPRPTIDVMSAPSDEDLVAGFGLSDIRADLLTTDPMKLRSRDYSPPAHPSDELLSSSSKGEMAPPPTPSGSNREPIGVRSRGGRRRGRSGRETRSSRPEPRHDNRAQVLDQIAKMITPQETIPVPEDDVATSRDMDSMSARSSKLEDDVEKLETELGKAKEKISELEKEHAHMVTTLTSLAREISSIKEMRSGQSLSSGPNKATIVAAKFVPSIQTPSAGPTPSLPSSDIEPLQKRPRTDNLSNVALGSRPIPARKQL